MQTLAAKGIDQRKPKPGDFYDPMFAILKYGSISPQARAENGL